MTGVTNKNSTGTVLSSYVITPNADSQVTGITEADGSTLTYSYDALGHLTSDVRTGTNPYSKSYTVDGEGNRTGMTVGGTSSTFNYNNDDWLTSTTGGLVTSYGYDNAGEQTSRTVGGVAYTLAYDYEGQLVSLTHGTTTVSFTYDATGRRMSRTSGGTTTSFYYDGGQVQLEAQGATVTAVYSYGNSLTRKDGEFPMFDGHGSERTVTNSSQTVTGTLNLDAFGIQAGSTGSSTDPYMYAATSGYRNDGDAGLSLVGARYYEAAVGRFITRDTDLSEAPYCYCDGDPVNATDPSGHQKKMVIIHPKESSFCQFHLHRRVRDMIIRLEQGLATSETMIRPVLCRLLANQRRLNKSLGIRQIQEEFLSAPLF